MDFLGIGKKKAPVIEQPEQKLSVKEEVDAAEAITEEKA
jgi:hypothetical protein